MGVGPAARAAAQFLKGAERRCCDLQCHLSAIKGARRIGLVSYADDDNRQEAKQLNAIPGPTTPVRLGSRSVLLPLRRQFPAARPLLASHDEHGITQPDNLSSKARF
jgi:hypothetical protein